eukprot:2699753-Lingulodinium_polyedra.AAC.1
MPMHRARSAPVPRGPIPIPDGETSNAWTVGAHGASTRARAKCRHATNDANSRRQLGLIGPARER